MPKIIQIQVSPQIETWGEQPGIIQSTEDEIYGLDDKGKLYYWGKKKFQYKEFDKGVIENNGKFYDEEGNTGYFKRGWIEMKDELNE